MVLASSGHHRRRTVGMVGNDPVMTLTPRIAGRYTEDAWSVCMSARTSVCEPSSPRPPALSSSRGYSWPGLKPQ